MKTLGIVLVLTAALVAVFATAAQAAYVHTNVTGEYGKEGPKAGGIGNGCRIAYQSANHRLYLYSDNKLYGLNRTAPGTVSPLAGFPVEASLGKESTCGDRDFDVDNTNGASKNNLYPTPRPHHLWLQLGRNARSDHHGRSTTGGENCGVAITNSGEVWGGNSGQTAVSKYNAGRDGGRRTSRSRTGSASSRSTARTTICSRSTTAEATLTKYTAAGGYSTAIPLGTVGDGNAGLALNGPQNKLYVANGQSVKAYDTDSGSVVETISTSPNSARDVAVDEPTDTLFIQVGEQGQRLHSGTPRNRRARL